MIGQDKETSLFEYVLKEMQKGRPELFECPTLMDKTQGVVSLTVLRDDYNYFERSCELVNHCILLTEENSKDESAAYFLPFYMKARD
mgnify:CR=1 FL=1